MTRQVKSNYMKRFLIGVVCGLSVMLITCTGCSRVNVNGGEEAVIITKPFFFGHGGVQSEPVKAGSEWVAFSTDYEIVDMKPVNYDEPFKDMMPKDTNPVIYHAAVSLQVTDSVKMYTKFGKHWYAANVQRPFQTMNRQQVGKYSMPELALHQTAVNDVEKSLKEDLEKFLKEKDIPARVASLSLGTISPQKEILDAYNQTGVQQQRSNTEKQRAEAEEARKFAEGKRAEADKAYMTQLGLNPEQYIRLQQIEMCAKKQNCSVFMGSNPVPIVSVK